ncbi:MAG TPA: hypothetical protein VH164_08125, partial [Ktedonobacteraceae bacterium]|nr:hypothetical protein [Ktedonobacteraceae bacterium]
MTKEQLSHLADLAGEHARAVLVELGHDMMPCWAMIDRKGKTHIMGTPWQNQGEKDAMAALMRAEMRKLDVVAYSLVVEAWAAQAPKGWKEGEPHIPSSEHPDRKEVVIAFATDGEHIEWRQWETKRNRAGEVIALERTDFDGVQATSWMTKL